MWARSLAGCTQFFQAGPINRQLFCSETVQITAARTPMHVIMNGWRLFVSVPSAGNIGHFEFSIFNALVSPFGATSLPRLSLFLLLAPASPNARRGEPCPNRPPSSIRVFFHTLKNLPRSTKRAHPLFICVKLSRDIVARNVDRNIVVERGDVSNIEN